ncbi:MAG: hypothetical protein A2Z20_02920 [Bdellovibrionales bacterium RBG_16_40_8]|nr:MAG: hypothetical protein A2Z20_02920 [Bdellovibrionales bacterium RBG_16_40_8]
MGNLAEISGQSAKEIEILISDSQRKVKETLESIHLRVHEGNKVCEQARQAFNIISQKISEINSQARAINEAAEQQEMGVQQTNAAMKQMDQTSQINSSSANYSYETSDELKRQSEKLQNITQELQLLIGGKTVLHETKTDESSQNISSSDNSDITENKRLELLADEIISQGEKRLRHLNADDKTKVA